MLEVTYFSGEYDLEKLFLCKWFSIQSIKNHFCILKKKNSLLNPKVDHVMNQQWDFYHLMNYERMEVKKWEEFKK